MNGNPVFSTKTVKAFGLCFIGLFIILFGIQFTMKEVAVGKIEASGGWVYYGEMHDLPDWMRGAFGGALCQKFLRVREIHLDRCANVDDVLWWSWPVVVSADELTLSHCNLTDESIRLIPRVTRLKVLAIHGCDVSDASVDYLMGFSSLEELFIVETKISKRRAKELQAALPNCKVYWSE